MQVTFTQLINPRCLPKGYSSHSVCLCMCVSVTALAATYLIYKVRCYKVPYGISNVCIVWVSNPLFSSFGFTTARFPHSLTL